MRRYRPMRELFDGAISSTAFFCSACFLTHLRRLAPSRAERRAHDLSRFVQDHVQVRGAFEALGVDLVDVFRARWPRGEPAVFGDDFQAADGRIVGGCAGEFVQDGLASERARADRFWRQLLEQ